MPNARTIDKPIEMIAGFSAPNNEGYVKINPIRFRIVDETGENQVYKIEKFSEQPQLRMGTDVCRVFLCKIVKNDRSIVCEIRYNLKSTQWVLWKI